MRGKIEQMSKRPCRIVIPVYRRFSEAEIAVMRHNLALLKRYPAVLVGGHGQRALLSGVREMLCGEGSSEMSIETFEDCYFASIPGYNHLLTSRAFFERFSDSSYILICQHDALILDSNLEPWLDGRYAFVGAPMLEGFHEPKRPLKFLGTLNGGLSLRNVRAALDALDGIVIVRGARWVRAAEKAGLIGGFNFLSSLFGFRRLLVQRGGLNEDMFWTGQVARLVPEFRLPAPRTALRFAFETCPSEMLDLSEGRLPLGCHAFARYEPDFWRLHAPSSLVPALDAQARQAAPEPSA